MQNKIGSIIDPPTGESDSSGIPVIKLDSVGSDPSQQPVNNPGSKPEIINGFETADPDTVRIHAASTRKRGRPRGTNNRSTTGIGGNTQTETSDSLIDLTTLLLSLHQMGASLCDVEELALDRTEAATYADAIRELSKHYPHKVNPKALAWLNFTAVIGGIYGTRFMAYRERLRNERKNRVVEMKPAATGTTGSRPQPQAATKQGAPAPGQGGLMVPSQIWNEPLSDIGSF